MNPLLQQNNQTPNSTMSKFQLTPQMQMIKLLIGNRNPKDIYYAMCKQKGVDPEEFLRELKQ